LRLLTDMKESLYCLALSNAPGVRRNEQAALEQQRESNKLKMKTLRKKKLLASQSMSMQQHWLLLRCITWKFVGKMQMRLGRSLMNLEVKPPRGR